MPKKKLPETTIFEDAPIFSEQEKEKLGKEFVAWSKKSNVFKWTEFWIEQNITITEVFFWANTNKNIERSIELGKYNIAARREMKALDNKMNAAIVLATMPIYDMEYRDHKMSQLSHQKDDPNLSLTVTTFATPKDFKAKSLGNDRNNIK